MCPIEDSGSFPYPDELTTFAQVREYLVRLREAIVTSNTQLSSNIETRLAQQSYESAITAGSTAQYWRGDKSWQTLNQAAIASFFGTRVAKTLSTEYTAVSAGLVVAYGSSNDGTYYGFMGYTGTSSADTLRAQASADYDSDSDPVLAGRLASITMPVVNGEKWKVDYIGTGSGTLYWIPIGG